MTKQFVLPNHPDPCPTCMVEDAVGDWVPEKHAILAKYINATYGARAKWQHRVYIDLFCGPGRVKVRGEDFTRDGGAAVAWHAARSKPGAFTQMCIGDLDAQKLDACAQRLKALDASVQAFNGAAVDVVLPVLNSIPQGALVLAYLDPYNLGNLSYQVISTLARLKAIDFALHFSTMDLQRNVEIDFVANASRFDAVAPGWRDAIDVRSLSKAECRAAFFEYWCGLMEQLGFKVSERKPLVRDARQIPLYRLVFLSRNGLPDKIWDDVAQGVNRELF